MASVRQKLALRLGTALVGVAVLLPLGTPADAGFFDRLFGGFRRAAPPPTSQQLPFSDPFSAFARAVNPPSSSSAPRGEANFSRGFCVRTCDGHYFPVQAQGNMNTADVCHAQCPATETRVYGGSNIDTAFTRDGSRYANLDTAYAFRDRLVDKCTCNGKTPFGLVQLNPMTDATLRPGDIVATENGLVAFNGRNRGGDFTPVQSYSGLGKAARDKLSEIRIQPAPPAGAEAAPSVTRGNGAQADNSPAR